MTPIQSDGAPSTSRPGDEAGRAPFPDLDFYLDYDWCLNPVLTVEEMQMHLREELERMEAATQDWRREEHLVNAYLLASGLSCTLADFLARRVRPFGSLPERLRPIRPALLAAEQLWNLAHAVQRQHVDRAVRLCLTRLDQCLDRVCGWLAREDPTPDPEIDALVNIAEKVVTQPLPLQVQKKRLQIPCPYRSQDMTHKDVLTLVDRYVAQTGEKDRPSLVLSPRTTGAYFAPLAAARLTQLGFRDVAWMTVRPKKGLSSDEKHRLADRIRSDCRVVLIDDHPNTGKTFALLVSLLVGLGAEPGAIAVLAPRHAVRADWTLLRDTPGRAYVHLVLMEPWELHKARFLDRCAEGPPLAECYRREGWSRVSVVHDETTEAINRRLEEHFADGWHVRLKRVFALRLWGHPRADTTRRVLAKSVGWGWLGYHAAIAASRLDGWAPRPLALRDGVLFTEWVSPGAGTTASAEPSPQSIGEYVATRVNRLNVREDPYIENFYEAYTGWQVLLDALRQAYGSYIGRRLSIPALRRMFRSYICPRPTLVDGRMGPEEWVAAAGAPRKTDFEHHNFGRTEMNIVDAAYDLASAAFEFDFTDEQLGEMVDRYVQASGDRDVRQRLFPYQLICGLFALTHAPGEAVAARGRAKQEGWNRRYLKGRDFLTYLMQRRAAKLTPDARPARWGKRLFFLDLDGVFDHEAFGFPTTTLSALRALVLLKGRGWTVVPCTGRGGDHVMAYCRAYGLPGGVAEHGALWIDATEDRRYPLVTSSAQEQLERCREAAGEWGGVFVDDAYRHSVRLYRFQRHRMQRLSDAEVEAFLARHGCDRLKHIHTSADTYLVAKGVEKVSGVRAIREHLDAASVPFAAIGDSATDLSMLAAADFAFAPANCANAVRAGAQRSGIRLIRQERQKGLLAAAQELVSSTAGPKRGPPPVTQPADALTRVLLDVPDRSTVRRIVSLLWEGPLSPWNPRRPHAPPHRDNRRPEPPEHPT